MQVSDQVKNSLNDKLDLLSTSLNTLTLRVTDFESQDFFINPEPEVKVKLQ